MPGVAYSLFWASFFILFYAYLGYPALLYVLVRLKRNAKKSPAQASLPAVTIIVTVYNEAPLLEQKAVNTLDLDYDADKLKIIFITDGSTDGSQQIVRNFPTLTLLDEPARRGKLAAMNRAMQYVETPIVVFSDANTLLNRQCIKRIVKHYADASVGGVAGEKRVRMSDAGGVAGGEGLYWKYESMVKYLDSRFYTIVGAAGELFSLRSSLYTVLPENTIIEDFVQSLTLCREGYVVRYEPGAYSVESASEDIRDEMERKTRISAGAFQAMRMLRSLFNPFRYPAVSFQLLSHRIIRWTLCPLALIGLFAASVTLAAAGTLFYSVMAWFQGLFYLAASAGWFFALRNRRIPGFYLPFYFSFMHFCVFAGFLRFIRKKQDVVWKKARRRGKI